MAQQERYYFFDEQSSTIWHTTDEERQPQEMMFLGSSLNPNVRMTASVMVKNQLDVTFNYKVKELS